MATEFKALDNAREEWLKLNSSLGMDHHRTWGALREYLCQVDLVIDGAVAGEGGIREGYDKLNAHRAEQGLPPIAPIKPIPGL